jgi:hypothetical protein
MCDVCRDNRRSTASCIIIILPRRFFISCYTNFLVASVLWFRLFTCLSASVGRSRESRLSSYSSLHAHQKRARESYYRLFVLRSTGPVLVFGVCFFRHGTHPVNSKDTTSSSIFLKHVIIAILARQLSSSLNYLDKNRCRFCIT